MYENMRRRSFCPGDLVYVGGLREESEPAIVVDYLEANQYDPAFVLCLIGGVADWYPARAVRVHKHSESGTIVS